MNPRPRILLMPMTLFGVLMLIMTACRAESAANSVVEETDFHQVSISLQANKKVLLLAFHTDHCPYCRLLEEDFLEPMQLNKNDQQKVMIRKIDVESSGSVLDFNGSSIAADDFVGRYNVSMTPTMLFLDSNGNEAAERIVGINTPSMFGGYIDDQVNKALKKIRAE